MADKIIQLPVFNIKIELTKGTETGNKYAGGQITSDLQEPCFFCKHKFCGMECPDALEWLHDRDLDILHKKLAYIHNYQVNKAATDTLESMILSAAIAGIDVESPSFLEVIETTSDAISKNVPELLEWDKVIKPDTE